MRVKTTVTKRAKHKKILKLATEGLEVNYIEQLRKLYSMLENMHFPVESNEKGKIKNTGLS